MTFLDQALRLFRPDPVWMERTKCLYAQLAANIVQSEVILCCQERPSQALPELFALPEQKEQPRKMAYEQLRHMVATANAKSGRLPSWRADLGEGFVASVFPSQQAGHMQPWIKGNMTKKQLKALCPDDYTVAFVANRGLLPKAKEIYTVYHELLGTNQFSSMPDTQGILDIAHLLRGDDIFIDFNDDPPFVHHLMELSLQAYISVSRCIKAVVGESAESALHQGMVFPSAGVRYCMNTTTALTPDHIIEFELPYLRRALAQFGGGFVQYCGYARHLMDVLVQVPEVQSVNSSYLPGREYEWAHDVQAIQAQGKCLIGAPLLADGESLATFFARVLLPFEERRGLVLQLNERFNQWEVEEIKATWQQAQEEHFRT